MKTIFLTSSLENNIKTENGRVAKKCDNSNFFMDELRMCKPKIKNFVFFTSSPSKYEINDSYANITVQAFNMDDLGIENLTIVDYRFKGNLEEVVMSADAIYLAGGHVLTQNAFFKEIGLKEILKKYDGVVIGQSAGSMNCASIVYAPPETQEDLEPNYKREMAGLGLTNIRIMPHMNKSFDDNIDGNGKSTYDYCVEDSYKYPVYGIYDTGFIKIENGTATAYGKTLLIRNGECTVLCGNKHQVEVNGNYNHNTNLKV